MNKKGLVCFVDDNIVGNPRYAKKLFRALTSYRIRWAAQSSVTIARNDELLELAARSGCMILFLGFETLSPGNLVKIGKKTNIVDEYEKIINKIHSYGIAIHGFFIFGFDEDDHLVFEKTVRFAQKMKLESAQFAWLVPYPGTAQYESFHKEGRIKTKDWDQYESNVVFEPKLMSPEVLQKGRDWVWNEFYSLPSIYRRLGVFRHNSIPLWIYNLYYHWFWKRKLAS
jgi:radical SAM superfamily enzyme YgiQ (UPF0313 family)